MSRLLHVLSCTLVVLSLVAFSGCGGDTETSSGDGSDDHGHDHGEHGGHGEGGHFETYAEALEELEELCGTIKSAYAEDDVDKAHDPLHSVGHLLEEVEELAAKESISDADKESVKNAVESLNDSFGAIDAKIHDGEESKGTYDEMAPKIDEALTTLKAIKAEEDAS